VRPRLPWRGELRDAFPFHPDTVLLLDKRLATVAGFQRTRGALRYRLTLAALSPGRRRRGSSDGPSYPSRRRSRRSRRRPQMLATRLFERVDRTAAEGVAQAYAAAAQDATASGLPLPERMTSGGGEPKRARPPRPPVSGALRGCCGGREGEA
jgi:hypothetical protein